MILHALRIMKKALDDHLNSVATTDEDKVVIGNIAFDENSEYKPKDSETVLDRIVISLMKVEEEKTLKNTPAYQRNPTTNQVEYQNPPVHVNLYILISINSKFYENAMTYLSRVIRFFQRHNVFTHKNSLIEEQVDVHDRLDKYKLILDMYSPSFEEINHIWSVLGGKQLPFVMYRMRVMDLQYVHPSEIRGPITDINIDSKTAYSDS